MSAAEPASAGEPRTRPRPGTRWNSTEPTSDREPLVPVRDKLLIDDAETAALLGLCVGSIANLESRDPDFPRPVNWALERKLRRRTDVEAYVAKLKQRRT